MDFNRQNIFEATSVKKNVVWDAGLRSYMLKVYNYMATGVLLTGIISLLSFKMSVVTDSTGMITGLTSFGNAIFNSGLKWLIMLAPLGIVFYMSFGINKMSSAKAQTVFWIFAALKAPIFLDKRLLHLYTAGHLVIKTIIGLLFLIIFFE